MSSRNGDHHGTGATANNRIIHKIYNRSKRYCECFRVFSLTWMGLLFTVTSFVVVGYQSLLPMLLSEKVFSSYCNPDSHFEYMLINNKNVTYCKEQVINIDRILPTAITSLNMCMVVNGLIIDFVLGPKIFSILAGVIFLIGCVIMAFADSENWLIFPGYIIMGIGGHWIICAYLHVTNALHKRLRSLYSTIQMSCYDTASVVFLVFYRMYFYDGISYRTLFLLLSIFPTCHVVLSICFQPFGTFKSDRKEEKKDSEEENLDQELEEEKKSLLEEEEDENLYEVDEKEAEEGDVNPKEEDISEIKNQVIVEIESLEKERTQQEGDVKVENEEKEGRKKERKCCGNSRTKEKLKKFLKQILKFKFWISLPWFGMTSLWTYFYMTTFHEQLMYISDHQQIEKVSTMTYWFGILLICVGFFSAVFSGILMSWFGTIGGISYLILLAVIQTTLSAIKNLELQYATMGVYVLLRGSIFGVLLYFNVEYFGDNLNTILGVQLVFASLCNLTNNIWVKEAAGHYQICNILFGSLYVLSAGIVLITLILEKCWKKNRKRNQNGEKVKKKKKNGFFEFEMDASTRPIWK